MPLVVPIDANDRTRRRTLLEICMRKNWFAYQSENPPGFVDMYGVRYSVVTYSLQLNDETSVTLTGPEVEGFVYATALEYDDVAAIAYRPGMAPND